MELLEDPLEPAEIPHVTALRERVAELVTRLAHLTDPERATELPRGFLRDRPGTSGQ